MKILALNGSPHGDKGNTALILGPFLDGLQEAGAEIELHQARDLDVKPCRGCFGCWVKTPGRCVQKDDMADLLPRLRQADLWVLATPVYFDGASGLLKNLVDRMMPLLRLPAEVRNGRSRHLVEKGVKGGKVVLVSNCGLWEKENFEPLLVQVSGFCQHVDREFAGALLRPHGATLRDQLREGEPVKDVLDGAREAGRQLVRDGQMAAEILQVVSRELVSLDEYVLQMNTKAERLVGRSEDG
jgi:multimeric flavodoxin WrbA